MPASRFGPRNKSLWFANSSRRRFDSCITIFYVVSVNILYIIYCYQIVWYVYLELQLLIKNVEVISSTLSVLQSDGTSSRPKEGKSMQLWRMLPKGNISPCTLPLDVLVFFIRYIKPWPSSALAGVGEYHSINASGPLCHSLGRGREPICVSIRSGMRKITRTRPILVPNCLNMSY